MKTNYKLKTIKTGLAIFAMSLSFTFASAQTATEFTDNLRTEGSGIAGTYAPGPITMISGLQGIDLNGDTVNDLTWNVQATVTPSSTAADPYIAYSAANRWGINGNSINGDGGESAVVNNLQIVNFTDVSSIGYSSSAISNLRFTGFNINSANGTSDNPAITVISSTNPGPFNLGQAAASSPTITFGEEYFNAAATPPVTDPITPPTPGTGIIIGNSTDVSSITFANGSTSSADSYLVIGCYVAYTFTTDPALSVNDIIKKDALVIYPTIVENKFTVNKAFDKLQLFDITGKTVKTFSASDALEVSGLVSGLYIVKIQSEVGIATGRLIVK